jgi:hypothetical protein
MIANISLEPLAKFKYVVTIETNQNDIHEDILENVKLGESLVPRSSESYDFASPSEHLRYANYSFACCFVCMYVKTDPPH